MTMQNRIVISGKNAHIPDANIEATETQFIQTDFETRSVLGKKGTRGMDKLTGLAIHCLSELMPTLGAQRNNESDRVGIVLGTAQGSMDSIVRFTYETLAYDRADYVNPALFPNTVMNCAASQSAIWHGLKGPNATISSGELSSFAAINYAISLLDNGYADTLIAGGAEELTEANIAANRAVSKAMGVATKFTEACAFFVVETESVAKRFDRSIIGEILAIKTGFNPDVSKCNALANLMHKVMSHANVTPEDITYISTSGAWPQTREVELSAVNQVFGPHLDTTELAEEFKAHGNSVSSQNALQVSSALDVLTDNGLGLLLAHDLKGNIGVMLIKGRTQ